MESRGLKYAKYVNVNELKAALIQNNILDKRKRNQEEIGALSHLKLKLTPKSKSSSSALVEYSGARGGGVINRS